LAKLLKLTIPPWQVFAKKHAVAGVQSIVIVSATKQAKDQLPTTPITGTTYSLN